MLAIAVLLYHFRLRAHLPQFYSGNLSLNPEVHGVLFDTLNPRLPNNQQPRHFAKIHRVKINHKMLLSSDYTESNRSQKSKGAVNKSFNCSLDEISSDRSINFIVINPIDMREPLNQNQTPVDDEKLRIATSLSYATRHRKPNI